MTRSAARPRFWAFAYAVGDGNESGGGSEDGWV